MSPFIQPCSDHTSGRLGRLALATLLIGAQILGGAACATGAEESASVKQPEYSAAPRLAGTTSRTSYSPRPYQSTRQPTFATSYSESSEAIERLERLEQSYPALQLRSASALVVDDKGRQLYGRNTKQVRPIASITKLMTAMVVLDAGVSMSTPISIIEADRDRLKNSSSRLRIGQAMLSRNQMMMVALMSSDNRAAHALSRTTFRGGTPAFVRAMNRKAQSLGMYDTHFVDPTGLDPRNRSTAEDLYKMVKAASRYSFIRSATSRGEMTVYPFSDRSPLRYRNTNPLVRDPDWSVEVSKTGFINEAGRCLVMRTRIGDRPVYVVFLGASGKMTPVGDSNRVRDWMLTGSYTALR